ncbi:MAG TPA: phenylalanine--tRNA ligase beta subunit-related protein [Thermoplasmata archaeon]|nr:phenylalanine--tRNA ligase beta subunit-related protein [Thermoplasmata archaeon]
MQLTVDPGLRDRFPGLDAHLVQVGGLHVRERDARLDAFVPVLVREFREQLRLETLKDEPTLRAYRDFYWRVGIDPTKTRPASEALLRRVLQGKELPRINTLVDAYNLASMETRIAIAAFDGAHAHGDIRMRLARAGEEFLGIGMETPAVLKGVEVMCEDAEGLVAIYPHRDSHRTRVTTATTETVFMTCGVPGIERPVLIKAAQTTRELVECFCR